MQIMHIFNEFLMPTKKLENIQQIATTETFIKKINAREKRFVLSFSAYIQKPEEEE